MRLTAVLGISHGRLRRRFGLGPRSRLDMLRNLVTSLVRHERIETTRARADEMQFYAEQVTDRARQARRHGPASHAPSRLLADGERPGAQALPGAGAPLRAPPGRLHADGAGPQERQPGPGREGGDRVQRQPAAAAAAAPPGRREDAGQPAAEGLPGGAAPRRRHGRVTSPLSVAE